MVFFAADFRVGVLLVAADFVVVDLAAAFFAAPVAFVAAALALAFFAAAVEVVFFGADLRVVVFLAGTAEPSSADPSSADPASADPSSAGAASTAAGLRRRGEACLAAARVPASTFSGSSDSSVGVGWKSSQTAPSGGMVTLADAGNPLEGTGCATT